MLGIVIVQEILYQLVQNPIKIVLRFYLFPSKFAYYQENKCSQGN